LRQHLVEGKVSADDIRDEVVGSELYRGRLISSDGKTIAALVSLTPVRDGTGARATTIREIRAICDAHLPKAVVAGGPILVEEVYSQLERDGWLLGTVSCIVLAIVIAILFRNVRWILLPLAVVHLTLLWTKALLVTGGGKLSMVSSPLVALVTVIGVATVVHITTRFREEREHMPPEDALRETMMQIGPAIFWTTVTTAAGFFALMACRVVPVSDFGLMMGLASCLVFVAAAALIPPGVLLGKVHVWPAFSTASSP
jgi:predicted RND superfamily exporter protein